jgi:hypothetical protein
MDERPQAAEVAVDFLERLRPGGPWLLTAIVPDGMTITITARDTTAVCAFVRAHDGERNIYYSVNPTRTAKTSKAKKTDIAAIEYLLSDLDPNDDENPEAAKTRYLSALDAFEPAATAIVDSGNGIQVLWRLTEPIILGEPVLVPNAKGEMEWKFSPDDEMKIAEAEGRAKKMMKVLGSAAGTQNIDRILRLPGTTNLPNKKKIKDRRVACPTKLIRFNGAAHPLAAFPAPATQKTGAQRKAAQKSSAQREVVPDTTNIDALPISERMKNLIRGLDNPKHKYGSRSEAVFAVVVAMAAKRCADSQIEAVFLDRSYPIAAHVLDQAKPGEYLAKQIAKAREVVAPRGGPAFRDSKDKHGNPGATLANAVIAINALGITCSFDLFHCAVLVDYHGDVVEVQQLVGELTNDTLGAIRSLINNRYGLDVGDANTIAAVKEIARDNAFDPVLDYLAEVEGKWDRVERITKWLVDYCGAEDTKFNRAVGRKHLIASVRRARCPGVKYDDILVMESPEGKNKSTAIEVLAGAANFSDQTILGVEDRVAQELLQGVWLYEIADLTDISKADVNKVKAFASRTTDRARPAYGRVVERQHRRCTLWATTNDQQYLKSQTGNRRFLPVAVGRIDLDALRRDRDQLWAEAAFAEATGESIMLDEKLWSIAANEQERRRVVDPWEDVLANMPETLDLGSNEGRTRIIHCTEDQERVASADVLTHVLGTPLKMQTSAHGQRLATIMERLGWRRPAGGTQRVGDKVCRGYWRPLPGRLV